MYITKKSKIKVAGLKMYEEYLERVIKANPDQYQDMGEVLNRYKTLIKSNDHLERDHRSMEQEYERLKQESTLFEKERNHEILQISNDIKDLTKKREEKTNERNNL